MNGEAIQNTCYYKRKNNKGKKLENVKNKVENVKKIWNVLNKVTDVKIKIILLWKEKRIHEI